MDWIHPKLIIGNKATGEYYFRRPQIEDDIIAEIEKGNHVLIAAPRRVGKTSVLEYLSKNFRPNWKCINKNIQGIDQERELYKRIYEFILTCLKSDQKLWQQTQVLFKGKKVTEISTQGIKLGDAELDFISEIDKVIVAIPSEIKVILFLDELPEILHQLNKKGQKDEANRILKNLRRWRQGPEFKSLCMVVTGSIGLHHIVASINGRTTDNNDYALIDFEALNYDQGFEFIEYVTGEATVKYSPKLKLYLLDKINYKIPYFINLLINEVNKRAMKLGSPDICENDIDLAFDKIVKESKHFNDWKKRLFEYFGKSDAVFMNEALTLMAHYGKLNKRLAFDLAVKHDKTVNYMELMNILVDDGYTVENMDGYVFRSPFLQSFWLKDNPIINE